MADEPEDVLELVDEAPEGEETEGKTEGEGAEEGEDEESEIPTFGEEAAPASEGDNSTIREMRAAIRERDREIAELRRGSQPKKIEVGEKPTLESCEYDEERFETELDTWKERKAQAEAQDREAQERAEKEREDWTKRVQTYEASKKTLAVSDFEAAENEVSATLGNETMALILQTEKPAALVYALHRSPDKLEELSKLNLVRAAMMIGKLEDKLQMTKRTLPNPDRPLRGNASSSVADKELERLEAEAERSGDRTKVIEHKRKRRQTA